ncbi:hypothetical protein KIN20_003061 [Parelaphostrongylus tenuis]|uniref:Uncharacterized protein n=1 Tax=Parelaphostrongylus tenuis TaxID=148309 RepID=A0AAD5QE01_PARTN|nr:hypothetical protein KIN20_003061 [Parelaphostrongylus tenuis]
MIRCQIQRNPGRSMRKLARKAQDVRMERVKPLHQKAHQATNYVRVPICPEVVQLSIPSLECNSTRVGLERKLSRIAPKSPGKIDLLFTSTGIIPLEASENSNWVS